MIRELEVDIEDEVAPVGKAPADLDGVADGKGLWTQGIGESYCAWMVRCAEGGAGIGKDE